jgi:hypothetical protein
VVENRSAVGLSTTRSETIWHTRTPHFGKSAIR